MCTSRPILLIVTLALGAIPLSAYAYVDEDDEYLCENKCSSRTSCQARCEEYATHRIITCGQYGRCNDMDGDRVYYPNDNCNYVYNPYQEDCDDDGRGDACDSENASYVPDTGWFFCYIERLVATGVYVRFRAHFERRLVDSSTCNAPPKWERDFDNYFCGPFWGTGEDCCDRFFNADDPGICDEYWRNDQCH